MATTTLSNEEILEAIGHKTVLELADLIEAFKTKLTSATSKVVLPVLPAGTIVSVKAVNSRGLEGWDWARMQIK